MSARSRVIASLSGTGSLLRDGRALAEVGYRLYVHQDLQPAEASIAPDKVGGRLGVEGRIRARETGRNLDLLGGLAGETVTLRLQDGGRIDLFVRNGAGEVTAVSDFYGGG
jgi:hypothetical protein